MPRRQKDAGVHGPRICVCLQLSLSLRLRLSRTRGGSLWLSRMASESGCCGWMAHRESHR